jgi:lysozyme
MIRFLSQHKKKGVVGLAMLVATPFVAQWEGLETKAYLDIVGVPTICSGSTSGVYLGMTKTKEECQALLSNELKEYMLFVQSKVNRELEPELLASLASFTYNVGKGAFERSTLLKKLNMGDTVGACHELDKWVYAGGKRVQGLINRRKAERELCLKGA